MLSAAAFFVAMVICGGGDKTTFYNHEPINRHVYNGLEPKSLRENKPDIPKCNFWCGLKHGQKRCVDADDKVTRIFGGTNIDIKQHPYLVSISDRMTYLCPGVILCGSWVIALGDQLNRISRANMKIRAGSKFATGGTEFSVLKIVRHPKFDQGNLHYNFDFFLVKIDGTFTKSDTIGYASLPSSRLSPNEAVNAVGFANPNVGGLRQGSLNCVSVEACKKVHTSGVSILSNTIGCVHSPGKTTLCSSDVGVPLVKNGVVYGFFSKLVDQGSCSSSAKELLTAEIYSELTWVKATIAT